MIFLINMVFSIKVLKRNCIIILLVGLVSLGGIAFSLATRLQPRTLTTPEATKSSISLPSQKNGNPFIHFRERVDRQTRKPQDSRATSVSALPTITPVAMATSDLNEDGVSDLVSAYHYGEKGQLSIQFGKMDSLYPPRATGQEDRARDEFSDSLFLAHKTELVLSVSPDFIATGDFDADGRCDIAAATRGGNAIYYFSGLGQGEFADEKIIAVDGNITAFCQGEVNRRDGLIDLVVGIKSEKGFSVLVFESPEGALKKAPEYFRVPLAVNAIAIGPVTGDLWADVVVASGEQLLLIHGRDRRLSQDVIKQAEVKMPQIEARAFSAFITAVAVGDFTGKHKTDIAILTVDGAVEILSAITDVQESMSSEVAPELVLPLQKVTSLGSLPSSFTKNQAHPFPPLITGRVSSLDVDHLLIVDEANQQIHILTDPQAVLAQTAVARFSQSLPVVVSLDVAGTPVAILPMRLNEDAISDLVILSTGNSTPTVRLSEAQNTFVVTQTQTSGSMAGTLEEAIRAANASPGLDKIVFDLAEPDGYCAAVTPITEAVVVDGTTQPGYRGTPYVQIKATLSQHLAGLAITGGNSVVRGLVLIQSGTIGQSTTGGSGVLLKEGGYNIVEHCYIGVDRRGTCNLLSVRGNLVCESGNSRGVTIEQSSNNKIGGTTPLARNIIAGNVIFGVQIGANSTANQIVGNYIGPDVTGTQRIASNGGIRIAGDGNIVGGTAVGSGNLISCGFGQGIAIFGGNGNVLQGNYVGVNPAGLAPNSLNEFANRNEIAVSEAMGTTIGGTVVTARNVIAADGQSGVTLFDTTSESLIQGNHIGVDPSGKVAIGRGSNLSLYGRSTQVGGVFTGARNVIFGGINIISNDNRIQGNYLGVDSTGLALPPYSPSPFTTINFYGVGIGGNDNLIEECANKSSLKTDR